MPNSPDSVSLRRGLIAVWILIVCVALYLYLFKRDLLKGELQSVFSLSLFFGYFVYLALGCLRGFTLIPATYLVLVGVPFFTPIPLFLLTLIGILVSSSFIYFFGGSLRIYEFFARKHEQKVARIRSLIERNELPIVIGWSFFPLAPTDLICYVCGIMKVDFKKCLFGVFIGEGLICGIYIFLGNYLLNILHIKL